MNFEYGYFGPAGGGSGEHVTVGSSSPAERVIDPQGEVNDIVSSAHDLKKVIDGQEARINAQREINVSRAKVIDTLTVECTKLREENAKLRSAMPCEAAEPQAAAWCAVWEQICHPHVSIHSTSGSGVDSALRKIRRWQEMERKLKGIING